MRLIGPSVDVQGCSRMLTETELSKDATLRALAVRPWPSRSRKFECDCSRIEAIDGAVACHGWPQPRSEEAPRPAPLPGVRCAREDGRHSDRASDKLARQKQGPRPSNSK